MFEGRDAGNPLQEISEAWVHADRFIVLWKMRVGEIVESGEVFAVDWTGQLRLPGRLGPGRVLLQRSSPPTSSVGYIFDGHFELGEVRDEGEGRVQLERADAVEVERRDQVGGGREGGSKMVEEEREIAARGGEGDVGEEDAPDRGCPARVDDGELYDLRRRATIVQQI